MSKQQLWLPGFGLDDCLQAVVVPEPVAKEEPPTQPELSLESVQNIETVAGLQVSDESDFSEPFDLDFVAPVVTEADLKPAVEQPTTITAKAATVPVKSTQKTAWPTLGAAVHDGLSGKVTKFEANLAAIKLLRELEQSSETQSLSDEQRAVLNRFTGWGGIKDPFDIGYQLRDEWKPRAAELKALVSDQEWESAKESTLNAHFTPIALIEAVWTALENAGYKGGRFLETSSGTGYMLGTMPRHLVEASDITAIELDSINAGILQKLYGQGARVINAGFESVDLPENYFDLVFTNVPFGNMQVGCQRRKPYSNWSIHNYFLGRITDLLRPGGIAVVITSSQTMDQSSEGVRNYLNRRAELLTAVRLPAKAFAQTADTDVVADLLVLRKRVPGVVTSAEDGQNWMDLDWPKTPDGRFVTNHHSCKVNRFFVENHEHVVGDWAEKSLQYGKKIVPVLADMTQMPSMVTNILGKLPADAYKAPVEEVKTLEITAQCANRELEPGAFVVDGDGVARLNAYGQDPVKLSPNRRHRVVGMIAIRDAALKLVREQSRRDAKEGDLANLRVSLDRAYDRFTAKFGHIHHKQNRWAMSSDPYWPLLLSLEMVNSETHEVAKAAIFTERTVYPTDMPTTAQSPADAALICQSELGVLDTDYMGRLLGTSGETVLASLLESGDAFVDPLSRKVEIASVYLSGNVRTKLRVAEQAGEEFKSNVEALRNALPPDLKPTQIDVLPGATWISEGDYVQFIKDLLPPQEQQYFREPKLSYTDGTGTWSIENAYLTQSLRTNWSTNRVEFLTLYSNLLNQKDTVVKDRDFEGKEFTNPVATAEAQLKQEEIKQKFLSWIWSDDARAQRLVAFYNEKYNCWAAPKFDGSRLRLPGYSHALKLRPHQLNAVARGSRGDNVLLGHDVGAGKSLEMICTSMELRRLGMMRKPMHVVPGQCLEDYCAEFLRAYPNARLLMATEKDFEKANRQQFVLKCATGNWDAVVLSHRMFESISADPEVVESYVRDILADLDAVECSDRGASRDLNRQKKDWKARLEKMQASWKKDRIVTFSQTGVDYLFIDEADVYKNLFRVSNMKNISGLSASNSQRAFDVFLKCMQIQKLHGDRERGLCMATATFISNTMAEMHTFMRYLQPYTLQAMGLAPFDAWAAQYGRAVNSLEVSPDGSSFRMHKRFKQFTNLPELMGMFRQVADIQTKEMLDLPRPALATGAHQISVGEPTEAMKAYVENLVKRAEAIRNRQVKPNQDNMLAVTGDGRKAALDLRLVNPLASFEPNGKIGRCVTKVREIWERTSYRKGAQIIFCDMGTPTGKSFNVYEDLRQRLIATGIPRAEIAFIHEFPKARDKSYLFAQVRAGVVRVIIGSTSLCGVGANMQTRLYAAHHLDCPWRPRDITQRDGRIERQGNIWEAIEIWRYVESGTFDAYSWQTITSKAQFIAQVMRGDAEVRTIEDAQMAALSYEEVKALACGNPLVRDKAVVDAEILTLSLKEKAHREAVWQAKRDLQYLPKQIEVATAEAQTSRKFADLVNDASKPENAGLVVKGKLYRDREQIEKILTLSVESLRQQQPIGTVEIGAFNGIMLSYKSFGDHFTLLADSHSGRDHDLGNYSRGSNILARTLEYAATLDERAETAAKRIPFLESGRAALEAKAVEVWPHQDRLDELRARSHQIALDLGLLKDMAGTEGMDNAEQVESELAAVLAEDHAAEMQDDQSAFAPVQADEDEADDRLEAQAADQGVA